MKRCPTCQKEFADSMRFCQTDGTLLVEEAVDPFKTMIASSDEIASPFPPVPPTPPADPFQTMIGGAFAKEDEGDDLLQLPEEPDQMKTMVSQGNLGTGESKFDENRESADKQAPRSPFDNSASKSNAPDFGNIPPPEMPKFSEPDLSPPDFGGSSSESSTLIKDYSSEQNVPKFDSNPFSNESSNQTPFNNPQSPPSAIPSPFDLSMPPGYLPPTTPPFDEPQQQKEPEPPPVSYNVPPQFNQNPFDQPYQDPFSGGGQMQQTEWTPPPAPEASWQNQDIGQNTPFQPPMAGGQGQNQTLAIVSLILGVVGIVLCQLTAPVALITGFMARSKAAKNPNEYGGAGLALAGIITGAIGTLLLFLVVIYFIFIFGMVATQNF